VSLNEFTSALDRWGTDLTHWPTGPREDAASLLAESAEARALLAAERQLEAFMRTNDPAGAVDGAAVTRLINGVMANLPTPAPAASRPRRPHWLAALGLGNEWMARFAASMAAAAMLGLVVADRLVVSETQQLSPIEALAMAHTYSPLEQR